MAKAALPDRIPATVLCRDPKSVAIKGGETRVKLFVRGLTPLPAAAPAVASDAWSSECRRTGRRLGAARTSYRSSLRRWGGAAGAMSSSAMTSASRR